MPQNCHLVRFVIKTTAQDTRFNSTQFYAKLINPSNMTSDFGQKYHIKTQFTDNFPDAITKSFTFTANVQRHALMYICNEKHPRQSDRLAQK